MHFKEAILTTVLFLICLVAVPHPFCYYLDTKKDMDSYWELDFKKNDFFLSCDLVTYLPFQTEKDIVVIIEGNEYARIKVDEQCLK